MIRWPFIRNGFIRNEMLTPTSTINPKLIELETAKEILEEIFHIRPADVDDMIQRRLEERCWPE